MLNGVTELIMMKADVLSGFEEVKVAIQYKNKDVFTDEIPFEESTETEAVYTGKKGWDMDLEGITSFEKLPSALKHYIAFIEDAVGVPIKIVSVGPDRSQTISV
jgi:adenylosuccinate synthase